MRPDITILITDDDPDDRMFIADALLEKGFTGLFKSFYNGMDLMNTLSSEAFDSCVVLILDLNMPVMDGYETLRQLRNDETYKHLPVVVLTSSSKIEDEEFCIQLGCNSFKRKPMTVDGFRRHAEELIYFANGVCA